MKLEKENKELVSDNIALKAGNEALRSELNSQIQQLKIQIKELEDKYLLLSEDRDKIILRQYCTQIKSKLVRIVDRTISPSMAARKNIENFYTRLSYEKKQKMDSVIFDCNLDYEKDVEDSFNILERAEFQEAAHPVKYENNNIDMNLIIQIAKKFGDKEEKAVTKLYPLLEKLTTELSLDNIWEDLVENSSKQTTSTQRILTSSATNANESKN